MRGLIPYPLFSPFHTLLSLHIQPPTTNNDNPQSPITAQGHMYHRFVSPGVSERSARSETPWTEISETAHEPFAVVDLELAQKHFPLLKYYLNERLGRCREDDPAHSTRYFSWRLREKEMARCSASTTSSSLSMAAKHTTTKARDLPPLFLPACSDAYSQVLPTRKPNGIHKRASAKSNRHRKSPRRTQPRKRR